MTIAPADKRAPLLSLLDRYKPVDETDRAQCARIREFVEQNVSCFERSNLAGHITGSAWVMDETGTRVLLTHHKKLGKWLQLGGHADGDSDVLSVALREAREESGLTDLCAVSSRIFDVDVHPIPARGAEPAHLHYDVRFAFQTTGSEKVIPTLESNELAWVEIDRVPSFSSEESLLRMARKWNHFFPWKSKERRTV